MEAQDAPALEQLVREGSEEDLGRFLLLLQPPELADLIESLGRDEDRFRAFRAVSPRHRAKVLRNMEEGERARLVAQMTGDDTVALLDAMQSDDVADILQELDDDTRRELLARLEPSDRAGLRRILAYGEESAGGLMQTELVRVRDEWTVQQAVAEVRRTRDEVGELHEIFVVDDAGRLCGWVKERALILADEDTPIREITSPVPIRVSVTMDQEELADLVRDYDLSSVPVVDDRDRLVGRVLVDDVIDVVTEEATEDIARLGGTDPEEVYAPSVRLALRSRAPWLLITFVGGIVSAQIIRLGEDQIRDAGVLFAFIPVIMGMGGGGSTQAATVTVRSLALGRIGPADVWRVVRKEVTVGLALAVVAGLLLWGVASFTAQVPEVALIASAALFGTMCLGAVLGVLSPLVLDKLGADPAVATSPFVTTANDLLGSTMIILATLTLL